VIKVGDLIEIQSYGYSFRDVNLTQYEILTVVRLFSEGIIAERAPSAGKQQTPFYEADEGYFYKKVIPREPTPNATIGADISSLTDNSAVRNAFAGLAMQALISSQSLTIEDMAIMAFKCADAMIKQSEKK
jgi:hypothetical protein